MKLTAPVAYQGGKQRLAKQIIDIINPDKEKIFYDLCCGSGAISIELISRGWNPDKIHMLDRSPWGLVWKYVGNGKFNLNKFAQLCDEVPKDRKLIQSHIKELSKQPAEIDTPYVFLLLQATSFGGKSIWIENPEPPYKWGNCSFRSYWLPTATSNRRSPVLAMHPEPDLLYKRLEFICEKMRGVHGYFCDIADLKLQEDSIIYIDPPYKDTTRYGHDFDLMEFIKGKKCFVSEGRPLSEKAHLLSKGMSKGGISGDRKKFHEEWLSEI